jgi:hypothetical protein
VGEWVVGYIILVSQSTYIHLCHLATIGDMEVLGNLWRFPPDTILLSNCSFSNKWYHPSTKHHRFEFIKDDFSSIIALAYILNLLFRGFQAFYWSSPHVPLFILFLYTSSGQRMVMEICTWRGGLYVFSVHLQEGYETFHSLT